MPRFVFSDFPLGNSAGKPFDGESQARVVELALDLLVTGSSPGQTVRNPDHWAGTDDWKADYCNIQGLDPETCERLRREFDKQQAIGYSKKKSA